MIELERTTKESKTYMEQLEELYMEAFPKEERKPFKILLERQEVGKMQLLSIVEKETNEFCGLAIVALHEDMVLLDYLAITPQKRGRGLGSQVLMLLKERYKGARFFLEIESTREDVLQKYPKERQVRLRRQHFYHKNGLKEIGLNVILFGVQMQILTTGGSITFDEYRTLYDETMGRKMNQIILDMADIP